MLEKKRKQVSDSHEGPSREYMNKFKAYSHIQDVIDKGPFVLSGAKTLSPMGEFDFLSGKMRTPCTTVVSRFSKI